MTAAIPPACCAGADDGKIDPQFCRLGRTCGGDFAGADSGVDHSGIGAKRDAIFTFADAGIFIIAHSVAESIAHADPDAKRITKPEPNADCDADSNRFGFKRGIGQ